MKIAVILCLAVSLLAKPQMLLAGHNDNPVIDSTTNLPTNVTNAKRFTVLYVNPFRFHYSVSSTDTVIAAPSAPPVIAAATSTPGTLPATSAPAGGRTVRTCATLPGSDRYGVPNPNFGDQCQPLQSEFDFLYQVSLRESTAIFNVTQASNSMTTAITNEQQCYKLKISEFSDWLMNKSSADSLQAFLAANAHMHDTNTYINSCRMSADYSWLGAEFSEIEGGLHNIQLRLMAMTEDSTYDNWYKDTNKQKYDLLTKFVSDSIVAVQKNEAVPSSFNDSLLYIYYWRDRIASVEQRLSGNPLDAPDSPFVLSALSDCSFNWYGRGDTKTSSVNVADISTAPATSTSIPVIVNTCYPPGTVSSGLGVSFVHDNVFAFLPSPDPANSTNSISTIGTTTNASVTPLYAIQYNASLYDWENGIGIHMSAGGAVGSSSGTTNFELLFGPSLSLRRRTFFITPSLQLARRDQLLPGYQVGSAQNTLTALPMVTNWKPGFALTFTFGIGP